MNASTTRAAERLDEFSRQLDANLLESAADDLQLVTVAAEPDEPHRRALRKDVLELWLRLVATVAIHIDPRFDPDDLPRMSVSPPMVAGVQYPPGTDPSVLSEPAARRDYEQRIEANRQKALSYNLQFKLRRLDDQLPARVQQFVFDTYTWNEADARELDDAIRALMPDPYRGERLHRMLVLRAGTK